jgi:hypothetical protein
MSLPDTIKHPETFLNSPAAGYDGVFDWSWTQGALGIGRITPMDFDGVIERKGNFLLFETKGVGVPIPLGQMYTFESAFKLGCFTIIFIEGKLSPESAKIWCANGFKNNIKMDRHAETTPERMHNFVADWYDYADKNPAKPVDITFLNKRIKQLEETNFNLKKIMEDAVKELGGLVHWPA